MNATIFVTYLEECLAPKLKRGDVVFMDNLPIHRVAANLPGRSIPGGTIAAACTNADLERRIARGDRDNIAQPHHFDGRPMTGAAGVESVSIKNSLRSGMIHNAVRLHHREPGLFRWNFSVAISLKQIGGIWLVRFHSAHACKTLFTGQSIARIVCTEDILFPPVASR
jgi:hypothetical protein